MCMPVHVLHGCMSVYIGPSHLDDWLPQSLSHQNICCEICLIINSPTRSSVCFICKMPHSCKPLLFKPKILCPLTDPSQPQRPPAHFQWSENGRFPASLPPQQLKRDLWGSKRLVAVCSKCLWKPWPTIGLKWGDDISPAENGLIICQPHKFFRGGLNCDSEKWCSTNHSRSFIFCSNSGPFHRFYAMSARKLGIPAYQKWTRSSRDHALLGDVLV